LGSAHHRIHDKVKQPDSGIEAAVRRVLEIGVPLSALGIKASAAVEFFVETMDKGQPSDRLPREGLISLTAPSPDFEYLMWQA
jgi:hypothetical protein